MHFQYFVIISPWKRADSLIWTNLNHLQPRMLCAKFWSKLAQWFSRRFVLISSMYFHFFVISPFWKERGPFNQNKPESLSPKDALCQVWLKLTKLFWRRRLLNTSMYFRYFVIISLGKGRGPTFEQTWIPFT